MGLILNVVVGLIPSRLCLDGKTGIKYTLFPLFATLKFGINKHKERNKVQEHSIIKLLGIKDTHVELWDSGENEEGLWFELHTKVICQRCPRCRAYTKRVHSYRTQKIQGAHMNGKSVTLYVKKRRYRCKNGSKTFYERLSFVNKYRRHTTMLEQDAVTLCAETSFTLAARLTGVYGN